MTVNRRWAPQVLALAFTAALLSAFVLEIGLRLGAAPWRFLDPRTDDFWAARLRSLPVDDPRVRAHDVEYDSVLGWRMKRGYASAEANHDARGFRIHQSANPRRSTARILMIGDSFTYGYGVRDNETLAAQLEEISGAEVINAGVNSFGADQAYLMWDLEGKKEWLDMVVLGYHLDDFYRNLLSVREAPKPYLVQDGQTYRFGGVPVPSVETWAAMPGRGLHLRTVDLLGQVARRICRKFDRPDHLHQEAARRSRHLLTSLHDSVTASGARLVVMLIPLCWQNDDFNAAWAAQSIRQGSGIGRIPLVDFTKLASAGEIYQKCHWNALGNRLAAEKLWSRIRPLLPPQ